MRQIICDDKGCRLEPSGQNLIGGGRVNTLGGGSGGLEPQAASRLIPITIFTSKQRRSVEEKSKEIIGGSKKKVNRNSREFIGGSKTQVKRGSKKEIKRSSKKEVIKKKVGKKLIGGSKKRSIVRKRKCV